MAEWRIEPLTDKHERGAFSCGKAPLDLFLRQHALTNMQRGVSRVFVAVRQGEVKVHGYYAASAGSLLRQTLPLEEQAGLPKYPLPTAHLGRLAVDTSAKGQGLGETLLFHFFEMVLEATERLGILGIDVYSKDEEAKRFYLKYGFLTLLDDELHLFLPTLTVRQMFE